MKGSTIDYATELIGSAFRIKDNPQSKDAGCGCGVSEYGGISLGFLWTWLGGEYTRSVAVLQSFEPFAHALFPSCRLGTQGHLDLSTPRPSWRAVQVTMFSDSPIPSLRLVLVVPLNLGYIRAGLTDNRQASDLRWNDCEISKAARFDVYGAGSRPLSGGHLQRMCHLVDAPNVGFALEKA